MVTALEDLEFEQSYGRACNAILVGRAVHTVQRGVAIYEDNVLPIRHHLQAIINQGEAHRFFEEARPSSVCSATTSHFDGLTVGDMAGAFALGAAFCVAGVVITFAVDLRRREKQWVSTHHLTKHFSRRKGKSPQRSPTNTVSC